MQGHWREGHYCLERERDHQIGKELSFVLENSILTEREMKIVKIIHFLKNTQSQAQPCIGKSHSRGCSVKTLTTGGNAIFIFFFGNCEFNYSLENE